MLFAAGVSTRRPIDREGVCALLILDEMQTAFGRAGAMWGFSHDQLSPDILTVARELAGLPIERRDLDR